MTISSTETGDQCSTLDQMLGLRNETAVHTEHGLLFDDHGKCIEIPGQDKIPSKAKVPAYHVREQDQIVWIWFGSVAQPEPSCEPPIYPVHCNGKYLFDGNVYHYNAPYQLIHDNLMDLSHLGYVHLRTIGGNASIHMNARIVEPFKPNTRSKTSGSVGPQGSQPSRGDLFERFCGRNRLPCGRFS